MKEYEVTVARHTREFIRFVLKAPSLEAAQKRALYLSRDAEEDDWCDSDVTRRTIHRIKEI